MDKTELVESLKAPYTNLKGIIGNTLLLFLATALGFLAAVVDLGAALKIPIPDIGVILIQVVLFALASLIYLRVIGWLGLQLQTSHSGEQIAGSLLLRGLWIALVVFVYLIPYNLSLFIYGAFGVYLSVAYLLLLLVFLPAIITSTAASNSFAAGFHWKTILHIVGGKAYWIAFLLSIAFIMVYSLISYVVNYVLLLGSVSVMVFYVLQALSYLLYLFLLLAAFTTAFSLLGRVYVETSTKRSKRKKKKK